MKSPKLIKTPIESILLQLGIGTRLKQYEVIELWPKIVGEQISKVTNAEIIRDGKLFVSVKHSTWRNELVFLKKDIIKKINKKMKIEIVKEIIFR